MIILGIIIVILFVLFYLVTHFPVEVCENSMSPTYSDGEILHVSFLFSRKLIKENTVVIVRFKAVEDGQHRVVIKRITRTSELYKKKQIYLEGDNPSQSYDSRQYGFIPAKYVIAVVREQREKQ